MQALPAQFHLEKKDLPVEEVWAWRGNRIHLDRYDTPEAKCKIILHHGVGTNGRQMTLLLGRRLAQQGYSVVAPDNLGYGETEVTQQQVTFNDWIELLVDFIDAEQQRDNLPIFLFGLSAGGMIAYHAAARNHQVKGIVGLTFLDERIYLVRKETSIHPAIAPLVPLVVWLGKLPLVQRIKVPMKWVSKMYTLTNDDVLLKLFLKDPTSAGSLVSFAFLSTFMTYEPAIEPKDFSVCPVMLAQPDEDRWTKEHLSTLSLAGIQSEFTIKHLQNAGHYPWESPGSEQLLESVIAFIEKHRLDERKY